MAVVATISVKNEYVPPLLRVFARLPLEQLALKLLKTIFEQYLSELYPSPLFMAQYNEQILASPHLAEKSGF